MNGFFCKATGCLKRVPNERSIMCDAHWALVPEAMQRAIWEQYEPAEESQSGEYWEAVGAAVEHVEESQPQIHTDQHGLRKEQV